MSYVIIAIVNEMMYRSLHLAYWQWWRGGRPRMPGEACCPTSQEALTCTQCRDKATRSMFRPPLLNEGASLHKASEVSLSRFHLEESVGWGVGMLNELCKCWLLPPLNSSEALASKSAALQLQWREWFSIERECFRFHLKLQNVQYFHRPDGIWSS